MLRLEVMDAPSWIELAPGVEVQVSPLSAVIVARAKADAAPEGRDGPPEVVVAALTERVAHLAILDWRGVGDADGDPLEVSPAAVSALMAISTVSQAFFTKYVSRAFRVIEEKKGFAPLPNGTSAGAQADTAPPAV